MTSVRESNRRKSYTHANNKNNQGFEDMKGRKEIGKQLLNISFMSAPGGMQWTISDLFHSGGAACGCGVRQTSVHILTLLPYPVSGLDRLVWIGTSFWEPVIRIEVYLDDGSWRVRVCRWVLRLTVCRLLTLKHRFEGSGGRVGV
jgi:hypothetical protein